jgi:cytochrome c oxidase subunit 4
MVLLALTVLVAYVPLGIFQTPIAMLIAVVKAAMVVWIFMHVKISPRIILFTFLTSLYILFIGFLFILADYAYRT